MPNELADLVDTQPDKQAPIIIACNERDTDALLQQRPDDFIINAGRPEYLMEVAQTAHQHWPNHGIVIAGSNNLTVALKHSEPNSPEPSDKTDLRQIAAEVADKVGGVAIYPSEPYDSFMHASQEQNPTFFEKSVEESLSDAKKQLGLDTGKALGIGL